MKKSTTHYSFVLILLLQFCFDAYAQTTMVSDGEDLQDSVNNAVPGATIVVSNGNYTDFEASFTAMGTAENPITIRAEEVGGVTLKGDSHFSFKQSAHLILQGFIFDCEGESTLVKLEGSNNIRITRNVFELQTTTSIKWVYIGGIYNDYTFQYPSHHNRVDHNIFQNKTTPGHYITIDGTSNEDQSDSRQSQYDRIDHNYFRNNGPRATNEQESIRVGWSQMSLSSGFTIIEHNLFEDCDGDPEIVSIKSSDNIVRHNTFRKSYGTLSLRHGNRNIVEGNYFFGDGKAVGISDAGAPLYTGGIRIYGKDHSILNNYMEGLTGTIWDAPITLTQGDAIDGNSSNLTKHFRAENVTIAYNTLVNNDHGIEIGFDKPGNDAYNTKVKNITIANNLITGSKNSLVEYINGNDQEGAVTWTNNLMYPTEEGVLVSGGPDFGSEEVLVANPNLEQGSDFWKTTVTTPSLDHGIAELVVEKDIQGQERPDPSNPGADHYSNTTTTYGPLTPADVGPTANADGSSSDYLFVTNPNEFSANGDFQTIAITTNLTWSATTNSDWVHLEQNSEEGNGTLTITVPKNNNLNDRTATVIISASSLNKSINLRQKAADIRNGMQEVTIISSETSVELTENTKEKSYDGDLSTRWSAEGVGQHITYDLGQVYDLGLIQIAMHKGDLRYTYFDLAVSTDGVDFDTLLTDQSNSKTTNTLENYPFTGSARYVRIIGGGNSQEDNDWNSITEVVIYSMQNLGTTPDFWSANNMVIHPIPASDQLVISHPSTPKSRSVHLYTLDGRKILTYKLNRNVAVTALDVSKLQTGTYLLQLVGTQSTTQKISILRP